MNPRPRRPAGRIARGPRPPANAGPASQSRRAAPAGAASPWVQLRSASQNPLIYEKMIAAADPAARPGDVVQVYDKSGALFGRGLYNPRSRIVLRMLTWGDVAVDDAFWRQRIDDAIALRERLNLSAMTDAYRLVHAEGDGLSGLVAERYADCVALECFSLGVQQRAATLAAMISDRLGVPTALDRPPRPGGGWRIVVRADASSARHEGLLPDAPLPGGEAPASVVIRENGLRFRVDLAAGHKTGFFCDQRENRRKLATLCRGGSVLDVCCYTGGFAIYARARGDATEVTGVDLDERAIALARDNANLNQARVEFVHADAFVYLRQMIAGGRQFDVVVLDPPKLAATRDGYDEAIAKYHDLNVLGMRVVRPGGMLLTCSCSGLVTRDAFIETVHGAARRVGRRLQLLELTGAGADHPIMLNCPESAYLKAAWLRVL